MVRPEGLEPSTLGLEGRCSFQLSYGRTCISCPAADSGRGREIRTPDILLPKQARYQTALYPEVFDHLTFFQKESKDNINLPDPQVREGRILLMGLGSVKPLRKYFLKESNGLASSLEAAA